MMKIPAVRLLALLVIASISIYLGRYVFDLQHSAIIFKDIAYWTLTLTFGLFLIFLFRSLAKDWRAGSLEKPPRRAVVAGVITVALAMLFSTREEEPGFHMVMDDLLIAGVAQNLHNHRTADFPSRSVQVGKIPINLISSVDKRPVFFPYLGSVFSDITGFRPRNTIYLNLCLGALLYGLIYVAGYRFAGIRGGVFSVILMASVPWLLLLMNSGGLEVLNLVMIMTCMLLTARYLRTPDNDHLGALCLGGILLSQTRYESVLFLLAIGLVLLWRWWLDRKISVPWVLFLCPPLLIPYLLQNRIFENAENWQMFSVDHRTDPFGVQYLPDNLVKALHFFFSWEPEMGNSMLVAWVGLISLIILAVYGLKRVRKFPQTSYMVQTFVLWLPAFLAVFLLLLLYGWEFDAPIIRRLALPLFLPLTFAAVIFCLEVIRRRVFHNILFAVAALYYLAIAFPYTSQGGYRYLHLGPREVAVSERFVQTLGNDRAYFVTEMPFLFVLYGKEAVSVDFANTRPEAIKWYLAQPGSSPLYYVGRFVLDPATGEYKSSAAVTLDSRFEVTPVMEDIYSSTRKVVIYRIVGVKDTEMPEPAKPFESLDEYLGFWMANLP